MSHALGSLLDLTQAALRTLAAQAAGPPPDDRPLAGLVVAVLPLGPTTLAPAAWVAAAMRLGAGVVRLADLGADLGGSARAFEACSEAARWADVLVTSHACTGFARAVAVRTGRVVVNAGEGGGEDLPAGVSLLAAARAARSAGGRRRLHVAVCGDLRGSRSAPALLAGLAVLRATVLLVPARGRDLPADALDRLARRTGRPPLRFPARTMRSLLDMVDTVLLAPESAAQLPLFHEVGVPPGTAERQMRREVEDTDLLFVAAEGGAADRVVRAPFRSRGRMPEGAEHRTGPRAVEALLRAAGRILAGEGGDVLQGPAGAVYASDLGLRCRGERCVGARDPQRAPPDFQVLGERRRLLACGYCGTRTEAAFAASAAQGRFHPVHSADARKILDRNLVLFRSRGGALGAGFEPSLRDPAD